MGVWANSSSTTLHGEHLTIHDAADVASRVTGAELYLTNSLFVASSGVGSDYDGASNYDESSATGVFNEVGAGHFYLVPDSSYRDLGTTAISSETTDILTGRTTYAPVKLTNSVSGHVVLGPQVQRDVDGSPDIGYHYYPIDYAANAYKLDGATVDIKPGTVIATYGNTGFWLYDNSTLNVQGHADNRAVFTRYLSVQEQSENWGGGTLGSMTTINSSHDSSITVTTTRRG